METIVEHNRGYEKVLTIKLKTGCNSQRSLVLCKTRLVVNVYPDSSSFVSTIAQPEGGHLHRHVKDGWFRVQAFRAFAFI